MAEENQSAILSKEEAILRKEEERLFKQNRNPTLGPSQTAKTRLFSTPDLLV
jgi:hypothetical protein